jgi:dCTP deaminase
MSVQGHNSILKLLSAPNIKNRLIVTPILEPSQIGSASIDVRLSYEFVSVKRGNIGFLDPRNLEDGRHRFRTPHHLNRREAFYLHPNEMVLASTLEYVRLPLSLAAYVTSRSKWGRLGLVIATATAIHPGFTGTITLELINHGTIPIALYPGLDVAQLIIHSVENATAYDGALSRQTGPHISNPISSESQLGDFWCPKKNT